MRGFGTEERNLWSLTLKIAFSGARQGRTACLRANRAEPECYQWLNEPGELERRLRFAFLSGR
jgi:hypothetical protein